MALEKYQKEITDVEQRIVTDTSCSKFSPGSYASFFYWNISNLWSRYSSLSSILGKISCLKTTIGYELCDLLKKDPQSISNQEPLLIALGDKKTHLAELEEKILKRPFSYFVDDVVREWTALDVIGLIEKIKYDKVYNNPASCVRELMDPAIEKLIATYNEKYWSYEDIEHLRDLFIQNLKWFLDSDDVFMDGEYLSFMNTAKHFLQEQRVV